MNFILDYLRLEDKRPENIRLPHECEWCGDSYGGRKRKYCSAECRQEEHLYRNALINKQVSKTDITREDGGKVHYIDPKEYGQCTLGVTEPNNPFVVYDLNDGLPQEDIYALKTSIRKGIEDAKRIEAKKLRKSRVKS
jgi:hypothetical protein|tara:strand:+ start:2065 stop:2478 length:414 start_codon:yes stop_codon:yes gene_type:complete